MLPETREVTLNLDFDTLMKVRTLLLEEAHEAARRAATIDPESEFAWKFIPEEREYASYMFGEAERVYEVLDGWESDGGWPWHRETNATATA